MGLKQQPHISYLIFYNSSLYIFWHRGPFIFLKIIENLIELLLSWVNIYQYSMYLKLKKITKLLINY